MADINGRNYPLPMNARLLILLIPLLVAGCDLEALLADPRVAQREADAKAIGSACRYGLRSIEDCYVLNDKASKSSVFIGWKEMDQYMRDNKVEGIRSAMGKPAAPAEEMITEAKADDSHGGTSKPGKSTGK
jgi:hypothetical protein